VLTPVPYRSPAGRARPDVVERERGRLASLEETLDKLKRAQESLRVTQ